MAEPWLTRMVCLRASWPESFLLTLSRCGIPSTHEQRQSEELRAYRVLLGQGAFTPGFESIVGQYLPLAAPHVFFGLGMLCNQVLRPCGLAWNRLDTCYLGMSVNIMSGFSQTMLGSPSSGLWMTWGHWRLGSHLASLLACLSFFAWHWCVILLLWHAVGGGICCPKKVRSAGHR